MIFIKTLQEIEAIRKSCQIVADVLKLIGSMIRPGITTRELDKAAEDFICSNNAIPAFKGYSQAGSFNFPATLCTSPDEAVVHGIPNDVPLEEGQILSIDVGVNKNGYFGDGAYTFPVGNISADKQRLLDVTKEALNIGISHAVAGNRVLDISRAIQRYVEKNGFSVVRELTGHGVGKRLHEDPSIPNFDDGSRPVRLKNGMTLAIEPMVNFGDYKVKVLDDGWTVVTSDGLPSAHFEHTILINDSKAEILTI
ncbi:MAG: type I methionyl aminopeptidase [Ignavibacteria bacterium]|nr:type I methionyl aminopeptidase [Ignavibacteria bacterium]